MGGSRGSGSGSGSSSHGGDASVGDVASPVASAVVDPIYIGDKTRNSSGDTCGYYKQPDGAACRQPRSCYDCLNTKLAGVPEGCVLSPGGACQAMSAYVPARDFRANHSATPLSMAYYNYFPNTNTSYCEPTDAACERCRSIALVDVVTSAAASQILLGQWNGSLEVAQRFCLGANGCVCLAACATDKWKNNVQEDCSPGGSNSTSVTDPPTDTYRSMLPIFMVLQFVLILMVIHRQRMYTSRFRRARPTQMDGPYNNPRAISSPSHRLQLTGWRAMQQELVNREKAQRGLVSLMTPRDNNTIPPQPQPLEEPRADTPDAQQTPPHTYIIYEPDDDDDIPELPPGTPSTPTIATRRRGSTDASVAMLEDGRASDPGFPRRPTVAGITEEREARSH